MKKNNFILMILIFAFFAIGIYSYMNIDSEKIASHWNSRGEVDDYMGKFWGIFFLPVFSVGLMFLFFIIPKIDPLKKNIDKFRKYYDSFVVVFMTYMLYVYVLTILANFGFKFNMGSAVLAGMGALFIYLGFILKNLKQNWFIGIRTPWTLSNEKVWKKTHNLGSKLFILLGIFFLFTLFLPKENMIFLILIPTIFVSIALIFYSWFVWSKEK